MSNDRFTKMIIVGLVLSVLLLIGLFVAHKIDPKDFSPTPTCRQLYSSTPISQVPAGCINDRGGLE